MFDTITFYSQVQLHRWATVLCCFLLFISVTNAQDFLKVYGDDNYNAAYRVKHFNGAVYTIGIQGSDDNRQSIFTKYDYSGNQIWQLVLQPGTALNNFTSNGEGQFMLVGRTLPSQTSVNNNSILVSLTDNGANYSVSCVRYYQQGNRDRRLLDPCNRCS